MRHREDCYYKGLTKDNLQWVTGQIWQGKNAVFIVPSCIGILTKKDNSPLDDMTTLITKGYEIYPQSLCKYSPFTDERGVALYEHDIISDWNEEKYEIVLGEYVDASVAGSLTVHGWYAKNLSDWRYYSLGQDWEELQLEGNIFQNITREELERLIL